MQMVGDDFALLELDLVRVVGKSAPETICAILGGSDVVERHEFRRLQELNAQFLCFYRGRDWSKARDTLNLCRSFAAEFKLARYFDLYESRIEDLERHPPADDWGGIWDADHK